MYKLDEHIACSVAGITGAGCGECFMHFNLCAFLHGANIVGFTACMANSISSRKGAVQSIHASLGSRECIRNKYLKRLLAASPLQLMPISS